MPKKPKEIDWENLTAEDMVKLEIAEEIGVFDKVRSGGWRCLSARESGKIGGILSRRKREQAGKKEEAPPPSVRQEEAEESRSLDQNRTDHLA